MSPERKAISTEPSQKEAPIDFRAQSEAVFDTLPEKVRSSDVGVACKEIQKQLANTGHALDLVYFNGFLERFSFYLTELETNEAEQQYPDLQFIVSAEINAGKGALILSPHTRGTQDALIVQDYEKYVKEHAVATGHKILRHDLSFKAVRIIELITNERTKEQMHIVADYLGEDLVVSQAQESQEGLVRYIQFTEAYMKSLAA